jgi:membrane associated rhomboid family serine protease
MSPRGQPAMSFGVPPLTRGVKWLGGITLLVSIAVAVLGDTGVSLARLVVFVPDRLWHGWVWQPFTYTFLNPEPISLLFALLGLWLLGASLEQMWGTRRFVTFYLVSGALGALATGLIGLIAEPVRFYAYAGNWSSLEGLIAAFAVLMPNAQIFLYFLPVQARWMLPISAGITLLFMVMSRGGWFAYLPQLFGLGAGVLLAGGVAPRNLPLRLKVWWIDRKLRRSKLRVVRGKDEPAGPFSGPRGSDKYLH